ncbi:MAG TPA: PPK2 family polyphosphate kinase [Gemmatimonadaceae bacterium]|nr:PPK2 family polyphosphate kinase [Gemmatimonadaceae bacterium]
MAVRLDPEKLRPITNPRQIKLGDADAARPKGLPKRAGLKKAVKRERKRIQKLQPVFYADGRFALLVVFQGRDASGKDGVIRKVFRGVNAMGVATTSFKAPTEEEKAHDFLWRIERRIPEKRMIGIFNRSHYEDIIFPRVHNTMPEEVWSKRYDEINDFERRLTENSMIVLKFFLHVSRDEQKQRLNERLANPEKNWKFNANDLKERALWDEYTDAYYGIIEKCSTNYAPWYVVPADDEDARNLLVARKIADTLEELDLAYPTLDPELKDISIT